MSGILNKSSKIVTLPLNQEEGVFLKGKLNLLVEFSDGSVSVKTVDLGSGDVNSIAAILPGTERTGRTKKPTSKNVVVQALEDLGEINTTLLNAVLRKIMVYETYGIKHVHLSSSSTRWENLFTVDSVIDTLCNHPRVRDFINPNLKVSSELGLKNSTVCFLKYLFFSKSPEVSGEFFKVFENRSGVKPKDDRVLILRKNLLDRKLFRESKGEGYTSSVEKSDILEIVRTWNHYRFDSEEDRDLTPDLDYDNPEFFL